MSSAGDTIRATYYSKIASGLPQASYLEMALPLLRRHDQYRNARNSNTANLYGSTAKRL